MLLKILKLLGLDVPAKIEAAKRQIEQRLELATHHIGEVAQEAAVIAALYAFAALTGSVAVGVGLICLYLWVAGYYGVYAGLGAVGAVLLVATAFLAATAMIKSKSLAPNRVKSSVYPPITPTAVASEAIVTRGLDPQASPIPTENPTSEAADLVEPLGFLLSKLIKYPDTRNAVLDELVASLRATSREITHEAIDRAANVIRNGDRANLVVILSGAALVGWLLGRRTTQL